MSHPMDSVFEENYKRVENWPDRIARVLSYCNELDINYVVESFIGDLSDELNFNRQDFIDKVYSNDERSDDNR